MATIENAAISLSGSGGENVTVTISCFFQWTSGELTRRSSYNLEIYFYSKDVREKKLKVELFVPAILENPVTPNTSPQTFRQSFTIPRKLLNEDKRLFNKKDELFARLRLTMVGATRAAATAKTTKFEGYL